MCFRNRKKTTATGARGEWWETSLKRWSGMPHKAFWPAKESGLYSKCNQKAWKDSKMGAI